MAETASFLGAIDARRRRAPEFLSIQLGPRLPPTLANTQRVPRPLSSEAFCVDRAVMVRAVGLEPTRPKASDFKSGLATNFSKRA